MPVKYIERLGQDVQKINSSRNDAVCIDFCSGNDACALTTIYSVLKKRGISLVGGTGDVEQGANQLSESIDTSHQVLEQSLSKVDETYELFNHITEAAEGETSVQTEISQVIGSSKMELETLCGFFDRIKIRYQEVMQHINRASKMGTTKRAMFENIDNMLSQIPPVVKDYMK